jgi:26S proteasome regulatory subunit N10
VQLVRIGKKLKKDKINVDVVCFGAEANEQRHIESLTAFVDTINGGAAEAGESHLVSVPTNVTMPEVLLSSAVCRSADGTAPSGLGAGGGGGGGVADFGFDPSDDPELAMVGFFCYAHVMIVLYIRLCACH